MPKTVWNQIGKPDRPTLIGHVSRTERQFGGSLTLSRIAILGATGRLGAHLVSIAIDEGYEISALVSTWTGRMADSLPFESVACSGRAMGPLTVMVPVRKDGVRPPLPHRRPGIGFAQHRRPWKDAAMSCARCALASPG